MNSKKYQQNYNPFPTDRLIRRMGFTKDQEGIMNRFINEEGGWLEHLNNSKDYIVEIVQSKPIESIAILGSGWLLDVPIDFLANNCKKVYLYDIRHPRQIVRRLKKYENVEFVNMDITGGAIQLTYDRIKKKDYSFIENLPNLRFTPKEPIDYTVSLNLLNQLDILIVEYLRKFKEVKSSSILKFQKTIQLNHLKSLSADKSCIITDYEELHYNKEGNLVENRSVVYNEFPKGTNIKEWIWEFDNSMNYYPDKNIHFKVKAIQL